MKKGWKQPRKKTHITKPYTVPQDGSTQYYSLIQLKIPKGLQANLPFKSKPKLIKKRTKPTLETKRAVLLTPAQRKIETLIQRINTVRNEKSSIEKKTNERKREELKMKRKHVEEMDAQKSLERKKKYYKVEGQKTAREEAKKAKGQ